MNAIHSTMKAQRLPGRRHGNLGAAQAAEAVGSVAADSWHTVERLLKESLVRSLDILNVSSKDEVDLLAKRVFGLERKLRDTQNELKAEVTALARALGASDSALEKLNAEYLRVSPMAMLTQIVPALAHDLNTPIANSNLVASSIQERLHAFRTQAESGELRRADLAAFLADMDEGMLIIRSAGERAAELSISLKDLAIDYASMRQREFALSQIVSNVLTTLQPTLRKTDIVVETSVPGKLMLNSYPGPLAQVLTNLLQNAVIHAFDQRTDGVIRIEAHPSGDHQLRLIVADNGVGMSRAVQDKLFTPFFTTRPNAGGSGVGLHYVRQLVEGPLGGSIKLSATPGSGSRFVIELPLLAPDVAKK